MKQTTTYCFAINGQATYIRDSLKNREIILEVIFGNGENVTEVEIYDYTELLEVVPNPSLCEG